MSNRFLALAVLALALGAGPRLAAQAKHTAHPTVQVYKAATCGCCAKWVEHLKAAGMTVEVHEQASVDDVKDKAGVPRRLRSCHTAFVGDYVIEGHVPADLVLKLLRERPAIAGIAVPGMPIGSPGMEQGERYDPYNVVAFTRTGKTYIYAKR